MLFHHRFAKLFHYTDMKCFADLKQKTMLMLNNLSLKRESFEISTLSILHYFTETKQYLFIPDIHSDMFIFDTIGSFINALKTGEYQHYCSKNLGNASKNYPLETGMALIDMDSYFYSCFDQRNGNVVYRNSTLHPFDRGSPYKRIQLGGVMIFVYRLRMNSILIQVFDQEKVIYTVLNSPIGHVYIGECGFFHYLNSDIWIWIDSEGNVSNKGPLHIEKDPINPVFCKKDRVYLIEVQNRKLIQILPFKKEFDLPQFEVIHSQQSNLLSNRFYSTQFDQNGNYYNKTIISDSIFDTCGFGSVSKSFCHPDLDLLTPDGLFRILTLKISSTKAYLEFTIPSV